MVDFSKYIKNNFLKILVKPNSSKNEILDYDSDKEALKVAISAPAEDNKANIEVIKFFKKLTKKNVSIKFGIKSKEKVLKFT